MLKERLGGRRLRFTDAERRRLARSEHALGRKAVSELDTVVTPETLMRWYRTLVAQKWTYTPLIAGTRACHYTAHYHEERNHQGMQNRLLKNSGARIRHGGRVTRRERLGGMLNFYHREAA